MNTTFSAKNNKTHMFKHITLNSIFHKDLFYFSFKKFDIHESSQNLFSDISKIIFF